EQELDSDQAPAPAFCQGAEGFRKAWQDLRDEEPRLELPAAPEGLDQDQTKFAAAVATWLARTTTPEDDLAGFGRLLAAAVAQINRRIEGLSAGAKESRRGKLLEERDALRSKRDKLDSDHPRDETALVLAQFAGDEQTGLPGLHQVLRGVEAHLTHWRELAPGLPSTESLRPLLDELNQLDQGTAGVLRACLEQWLAPWQEADDARGRIQKRLDEIDEQLAQTLPVADTGPLQRALDQWKYSWDGETKRRRGFAEAEGKRAKIEARRALARALTVDPNESPFTAVQPLDDKVRAELAKALDQTLCRFQFDAGFLPVRPHDAQRKRSGGAEVQGYQLQTRDGRPSHVFSTGQKGQVALAYMLAQALLLRAELPHRVLVLDDTSTAFDLGNIVRQATWLRQLAYSAKAQYRWQIFVASHHEELTNRLIELLVPPEGRELRLIRFLRWSPETGPEIEQHRARQNPNLAGDDGASLCEGIAKRLQRSWPALRVAEHG
ncbi:MAG: hypothetical protein L0H19_04315, partial [Salinisphaera sp.]|nr:hypothetical protein [Salinisphaera sp.]